MWAVARFNSQLSDLSNIPFESLTPLSQGETHVTSYGSEQVQACVHACVCV